MSPPAVCPGCGSPASEDRLQGLCPTCLVALASEPISETGTENSQAFGDYELLSELATGGMGIVFRAKQRSLNRIVALKMTRSRKFATASEVERFHMEARAAANLDHPNIVPIFEVGEFEGNHFFSMKLIEGESLAEQTEGGRWRWTQQNAHARQRSAAAILVKVAYAVHHAHERGVLHRDLKPSNILIDDAGEPHLTDFGLAKLIESGADLTRSFAVMGTLGYMSPEQAAGKSRQITISADLYSLGAILYELLTGRPPFAGEDPVKLLHDVIETEPVRPRAVNPWVDEELETICLKCLEKSPSRRYASALALAQDLERWLRHEPVLARPSSLWQRGVKWVQRRPLRAAFYFVLALATATVASVLLYAARQRHHATTASSQAAEAIGRSQVRQTQDFFATENPVMALAHLSRLVRETPKNQIAATRLMAALSQRPFALPLWQSRRDWMVEGAEFSPDGKKVALGTQDGTVRLLDATTGQLLNTFKEHRGAVTALAFDPNSRRLVTGGRDGLSCIWEPSSPEPVVRLLQSAAIRKVEFEMTGSNVLIAFSNSVVVWNPTRNTTHVMTVSGTHVRDARFSGDGRHIVAASQDGSVFVWGASTGAVASHFKAHTGPVRSVRFDPTGEKLVTASDDGSTRIWDIVSAQPLGQPLIHDGPVNMASLDASGEWVITASADGTLRMWDWKAGREVTSASRHSAPVTQFDLHSEAGLVLSGADDGTARIWEIPSGSSRVEPVKHPDFVEHVRFSTTGQFFLTVCADNVARVWRLPASHRSVRPPDADETAGYALDASGRFFTRSSNGWITVFDSRSGQPVGKPLLETEAKTVLPDSRGQFVFTLRRNGTARLWTTALVPRDLAHELEVTNGSFSRDGASLITMAGPRLRIWNCKTGSLIRSDSLPGNTLRIGVLSNKGELAFVADSAQGWIVDARDGSRKHLPGLLDITWAEFSSDARTLLVVTGNDVRLWTMAGEAGGILEHASPVRAAHFSGDGKVVVTASDTAARVWNLASHRVTALIQHRKEINSASFSPDDHQLVTASVDRTLRVWDVETGQPLSEPLESELPVWDAHMQESLVVAMTSSGPITFEVPIVEGIAPDWLADLGEAVAGQRLTKAGTVEPVESGALLRLKDRIAASAETDRYSRWAKRFLAHPDPVEAASLAGDKLKVVGSITNRHE